MFSTLNLLLVSNKFRVKFKIFVTAVTAVTTCDDLVTTSKPLLYIGGDGCDPFSNLLLKFSFLFKREERHFSSVVFEIETTRQTP